MTTSPQADVVDEDFLRHQRALLEELRASEARTVEMLATEVNALLRRREAGESAEEGFGTGETASVELERARAEHAAAVERLARIDDALRRIDTHTYGRCESCGQSIGRARLEAIPTATRCITCQARAAGRPARGVGRGRSVSEDEDEAR
ncbi:MAG TPA: TraR/DksA family transcriptional regulator [Acidimicrobiales bacterium]|nr:TraR/DksA family transcriptional regulator [Acidimicrobiales bacterium]